MGNCCSSQPEKKPAKSQQRYAVTASKATVGSCQVLFFPDTALPCHHGQSCRRGASCTYAHQPTSLSILLDVFDSAKGSMDVCVFTITCNEIADALIRAYKRGVRVRIISDDDQMRNSQGSDVKRLAREGISVKIDNSKYHMHNKFVIIDKHILANGSFNWTRQAVLGNNENVVIQENQFLAQTFGAYFEKLWREFASV